MGKNKENMLRLDWPVDQHGYEFVKLMDENWSANSPDPYVSPTTYIQGKGGPYREYSPFSDGLAIHRELAYLNEDEDDEKGVLEFCQKYGLITHNIPSTINPTSRLGVFNAYKPLDGMFSMQKEELCSLQIFWSEQRSVRDAVLALDDGNKAEAIRLFNNSYIPVRPQINVEGIQLHRQWQLIPQTLIAAIWLLIEQEISDGRYWLRCRNCQTWFVPKTARGVYCRDACKTAWNRNKRKGA